VVEACHRLKESNVELEERVAALTAAAEAAAAEVGAYTRPLLGLT